MSLHHNPTHGHSLARLVTWAAWVLLNVAGVLGGYFLALGMSGAAARTGPSIPDRGITALTIPLIGLLLGLGQWLVVLRGPARRVAAALAGWLLLAVTLTVPITGWVGLVWVGAAPALVTGAVWVLDVVSR